MDTLFLEILESMFESRFAAGTEKVRYLNESISRIDKFRFFAELAWENKLIKDRDLGELASNLQEIGRVLGGWKKGLTKTPLVKRGETSQ